MQIRSVLAMVGLITLLGLSAQTQAQFGPGTTWNAHSDFYLSPTADGWTGATSPTALGAAWGYYAANVNYYGNFPSQIGSYYANQNLYRYSSINPLGSSSASIGNPGWANTGGAGFAYYSDNQGWGTSLGRFDTSNTWWDGAPGYSQGISNLIWMQSTVPGGALALAAENAVVRDGIAAVLTWSAPETGVYTFAGQFIAANQPGNGAAVAIVDSLGGTALLSRTVLNPNASQSFSFTASYTAGDVVQFQVGSDFKIGNAVGLQVTATAIPEPSSGLLFMAGLGALGLVRRLRRQA